MPLKALNARFGLGVFQKRQVGSSDTPADSGAAVSQRGGGALGNFAMLLVNSGAKWLAGLIFAGSAAEFLINRPPHGLYWSPAALRGSYFLDVETTFEREDTEKGANY